VILTGYWQITRPSYQWKRTKCCI